MTKVEHTRIHRVSNINNGFSVNEASREVLVTNAELVLVDLPFEEANRNILCKCIKEMSDVKVGQITLQHKLFTSLDYWRPVKPILISRTEKIEVGDWVWDSLTNEVFQIPDLEVYKEATTFLSVHKILALPEHFSSQQLQDIVDGKLKEGKVVVECEKDEESMGKLNWLSQIKLNSSNHVVLHQVEEKMYTREEVKHYINLYWHHLQYAENALLSKEWFEQNVK